MKSYTMKSKDIALNDDYDVIVVGGGPAGCAAAISSAREGAKTLLIEASGMLGGMATIGLVNAFTPVSDGVRVIYGGISKKVFELNRAAQPHVPADKTDWVSIDYETIKRIYDKLVTDSGAHVLFNTMLSSVEMKDDETVDCIICSNKAGLTAYRAKVYVDCTGDADLAAWAGASYKKGDDETGEVQFATLCFILSNIDSYAYDHGRGILHWGNKNSPIHEIIKDPKYAGMDEHVCCDYIGPNTMGFNAQHVGPVDNTDPQAVSKAIMLGRKKAEQFRQAITEYYPRAFGDCHLTATASAVGVRESRRIEGDFIFTVDEYYKRASYPDEICRNNYYIDIHGAKNEKEMAENRYKEGESHGIPYRCLTPKGLKNVLVAGRSISCDRITQGSVRVMPACLCTGEAAGMAAAFSAETECPDVHTVDTQRLRRRLTEEGAYLPKLPTDTF
jgi:hypothetical protein